MGGGSSKSRTISNVMAISHEFQADVVSEGVFDRLIPEICSQRPQPTVDYYGNPALSMSMRFVYDDSGIKVVRLAKSAWVVPFKNTQWQAHVKQVHEAEELHARVANFHVDNQGNMLADLWLFVNKQLILDCRIWMVPLS